MTDKINKIARFLYSKKAMDIVALDVRGMTVITDCMLIANGRNALQVHSLADELIDHMAGEGVLPVRQEGKQDGQWIIIDYGDVLVHLFHPELRAFYKLDKLWLTESNRIELNLDSSEE